MSKRLEKCSECDRVYVRDSETGKVHPQFRAEQICDACHEEFERTALSTPYSKVTENEGN